MRILNEHGEWVEPSDEDTARIRRAVAADIMAKAERAQRHVAETKSHVRDVVAAAKPPVEPDVAPPDAWR